MPRLMLLSALVVFAGCGGKIPLDSTESLVPQFADQAETASTQPDAMGVGQAIQERKIIYEADVTVIVKDFSKMEADVPDLVKRHGGYLSEVEIDRTHGEFLSGRWVVRVPVEEYGVFLDELSALGIPERFNQTAQDVTEEYIDLEARIANKKRLEERILELLEKSEGAIKDVIEVERELARVRSEIEQMQGRMRYLENRTSLTTITIRALERQDYVPPQAPSFTGRVGHAWQSSLLGLRRFGEGLVVCLTFLLPWLVLFSIFAATVVWLVRRLRKRRATSPPDQDTPS